jgi:hypothetical protein
VEGGFSLKAYVEFDMISIGIKDFMVGFFYPADLV